LGISPKLIEITTDTITLASKLIGDPFPAYERVVPGPTGTAATIDRGELTRALRRLEAIYDRGQKRHMRIARVVWAPDADGVHVQHTTSDISDDVLAAETNGAISFAVQVHHLVELLDAFEGERVVLDVKGVGQPILISDPEAPYCRAVQMPCRG
jgi:DNA polymerase III sliding clamp (beta) subunit (PCNA family)